MRLSRDWRTWAFRAWIVFFTAATVWATGTAWSAVHDLRDLVRAEEREERLEQAAECVEDWERSDGAEAAIASAMNGMVNLLRATFPNADPEIVERFVTLSPEAIEAAQDELAAPTCDRGAAEDLIRREAAA